MGLMCYEDQSGTSRLQKFFPLGDVVKFAWAC